MVEFFWLPPLLKPDIFSKNGTYVPLFKKIVIFTGYKGVKIVPVEGKESEMIKVVVYDCTYGGELFADQLKQECPIINVIRVIDWRHSKEIKSSPRSARKYAREALLPYIGKVDLIILANHLLSITSLKYFRRKFKKQKFIGFNLKEPDTFVKREIIILTTKAITRTINYHNYVLRLKRKTRTLSLDAWVDRIDEGVFTKAELCTELEALNVSSSGKTAELILANSIFNDLKPIIRECYGRNLKIHDSFNDAIRESCKILSIRGGAGKKSKY